MSPGGIAVMVFMPVSGILMRYGVDTRYLIFVGLLCVAGGSYWTSLLTPDASPGDFAFRRCAQLFGMAFIFAPVNVVAYANLPKEQTSNATALFNLVRNEGASLGIAIFNTLVARRLQFHQSRLVENLDPLNFTLAQTTSQLSQQFQAAGYDSVSATQMSLAQIYQLVQQQAGLLANMDIFWLFSIAALCVAPVVFLMRKTATTNAAAAA
jgi:DHA2 family multidrug resistance protein